MRCASMSRGFDARRPPATASASHTDDRLLTALGFQVDAELLTFLIKVAALEAERTRGLRDAVAVRAQLREDRFALERRDAFGQRTARDGAVERRAPARQHLPHGRRI